MPDRELAEHIALTRKDVFGLRFAHATGELENTAGLRAGKRELARAMTIAAERERERAVRARRRKRRGELEMADEETDKQPETPRRRLRLRPRTS